jgi:DNA/RNA-binding domain of Phe-tRNA-synthetase-like protein
MTLGVLNIEPHPLLDVRAFVTTWPQPLGSLPTPSVILDLLSLNAPAPLTSSDAIRAAVRNVLRGNGFKPTGRSKPASEYLVKAAHEGKLTSINLAVDICNVVSLHSGLPISVVDVDRLQPPLRIAIATAGAGYVFNASGQVIDVEGLLCLHDQAGPCANAVKDAQRAKTKDQTLRTLTIIWGGKSLDPQLDAARDWYYDLLLLHGADVHPVTS